MTRYSRRSVLSLAAVGAGVAVAGYSTPARADDLVVAACGSIPSTADDNVIKTVYRVGTNLGVSARVMLAGFEAGWVESHMNNLPCGDQDSLGVFQQRPSQGWGTPEQIMNVAFASNSFFTRAITVAAQNPSWSAGRVAQGVQRSAFPDRYDAAQAIAEGLIARARDLVGPPAPAPVSVPGGPAVEWGDSVQFFAAGQDDNKLWQKARNGAGTWQNWADLGGTIAGTPSAVRYGDLLAVTARTPGNLLHHRAYRAGTGWLPWVNLSGPIASDPVTIGDGNTVHVFARGTNNAVQYRHYTAGHTTWSPYINLGGAIKGKPTVVKFGDSLALFARGTDDNLWQQSFRPGQGWLGWTPHGGPIGGDPTAISEGSTLHLFARGTNAKLQHKSYTTGRGWTPFVNLDGGIQGTPTAAEFGDSIAVFARGTDNNLWQRSWRPTGWQPWTPHGGPIGGDPHTLTEGTTLHIFARGTNAKLQHKNYTGSRGWTPYINLDGAIQ
jgi:hypothetical protein